MLDHLHLAQVGEVRVGLADEPRRQDLGRVDGRHVESRQEKSLTPDPVAVAFEEERFGAEGAAFHDTLSSAPRTRPGRLAGVALGDRGQDPVRPRTAPQARRHSGQHPVVRQLCHQIRAASRPDEQEFVEGRAGGIGELPRSSEVRDPPFEFLRAGQAGRGELAQPAAADGLEPHRRRQRHQPLVGADVRGRLGAADVLFAGREGQAEGPVAVFVHRLAGETARHLADVFFRTGEEAEVRSAEPGGDAEALSFAAHHVETETAAAGKQSERRRLRHHLHREGAARAGGLGDPGKVLDDAEEVGRLHCNAARFRGCCADPVGIESPVGSGGDGDDVDAGGPGIGLQNPPVHGVDRLRHHGGVAFSALNAVAEEHRFDQRRGAVVQRGVGHLELGEAGHQSLELEDDLEGALRNLGLVRCVGGEELRPRQHRVDDRGLDVAVDAGAEKARHAGHREVFGRHPRQRQPDGFLVARSG